MLLRVMGPLGGEAPWEVLGVVVKVRCQLDWPWVQPVDWIGEHPPGCVWLGAEGRPWVYVYSPAPSLLLSCSDLLIKSLPSSGKSHCNLENYDFALMDEML